MKPWAKYEVGFIDHGKFKAITANAICLWLEGKNYADDKFTDGLLPDYEAKRWRFYSKKSVELLTTSCGIKPGTDAPYAALWDVVDGFGFKMHDYLEHNDCREKALERIAKYETKKATEAAKKAKWRAEQAAKHAAGNGGCPPLVPTHVPASVPPLVPAENTDRPDLSMPIQKTEDRRQNSEAEKSGGREPLPPDARSKRPVFSGHKLTVFEWQLEECVKILGTFTDAFDLHAWFYDLDAAALKANLVIPKRDNNAWLEARLLEEIHKRQLPITLASMPAAGYDAEVAAVIAKGPSKRPW